MTDEETCPKRPNAKYNLSKPDRGNYITDEDIIYYYNRERRLEKAPKTVKDLYTENKSPVRFGLFRSLVADKQRAILFFTIIIIFAVTFLFSYLNRFDNSFSLDGNTIEIKGTVFEGATITVLKKTQKQSGIAYSGAVNITVYPAVIGENEENTVFYHRISFSPEKKEEYRFVIPFDAPELLVIVQTEKSTISINLKPE